MDQQQAQEPMAKVEGRAFVAFPPPLVRGRFVERRQRFLADMLLEDGSTTTAHCPNTGSMRGCLESGAPTILWNSQNLSRKLLYTWKAIRIGGIWVGVDTAVPNRLVEAAIRAGEIPGLRRFARIRRERPMGTASRVDLLLEGDSSRCYVEVKNVTLVEEGTARFPDAVTSRGQKHLQELMERVSEGYRAAMVYLVQRQDATRFCPADDIDPDYGRLLRQAHGAGVELYALLARVSPGGVSTERLIPYEL